VYTQVAQIFRATLLHVKSSVSTYFEKNGSGYVLGDIFHKLFWSLWNGLNLSRERKWPFYSKALLFYFGGSRPLRSRLLKKPIFSHSLCVVNMDASIVASNCIQCKHGFKLLKSDIRINISIQVQLQISYPPKNSKFFISYVKLRKLCMYIVRPFMFRDT
jgi:hypothetical protein